MEQNFNQTLAQPEAITSSFFKKALVVIIILLFVIVLILAGLGWYIKSSTNPKALTAEEISNLIKPASTTPLTEKERKEIVKPSASPSSLSAEERANLLKN